MQDYLAVMLTMTTYGTWLRGDQRGWVEDGRTLPPDPVLEQSDRVKMLHSVFIFPTNKLFDIGSFIGNSLIERLNVTFLAMTVQTWHVHFVISATSHELSEVVKCAKDSVRYGLRPGRPIWTEGCDKRFCFDTKSVIDRINYVERHNTEGGLPARPWNFIVDWREDLRTPRREAPPSLTGG